MRRRSATKFLAVFLLLVQLISLSAGVTVFAADTNDPPRDTVIETVPPPKAYGILNGSRSEEPISMGGYNYTDAIVFSMGYNSGGGDAEVNYNFEGKYTSLTFEAGYMKGSAQNVSISIAADGVTVLEDSLKATDVPKTFTVDLTGVHKLSIHLRNVAYDTTYYAVAGLAATPVDGEDLTRTYKASDPFFHLPCYQTNGAELITDEFDMSGFTYKGGYAFRTGYVLGHNKSVSFNFKKQYKSMEFDICRYLGRSGGTAPGYITIRLDGEPHPDYNGREMLWNDLALHVELDLTGVSQVTIVVDTNGYNTAENRIGDIQLTSDGVARSILLDASPVSGTDDYTLTLNDETPEFALNPRVYPSDAPREYNMTVEENEFFTVSEDGVVTARHAGSGNIVFTLPNDPAVSVECAVTSAVTAHIWNEGEVTKEPTWDMDGEELFTCTVCEETKTEVIEKIPECEEHTWDEGEVIKEPTVTEEGEKFFICTVCGMTKTEPMDVLECVDHVWDDGKVDKEPTYTEPGEMLLTCTICGATKNVPIDKLECTEHTWDNGEVTKEPTPTEEGEMLLTCTLCGETKTETIEKSECVDHIWDDGEVTKEPTYTEAGEKALICIVCGATKTEAVDKLECTDHEWDKGKVTKEPTTEAEGEKTFTCTVCGEAKTEIVDKLTNPFNDVDDTDYFFQPVLWAVQNGITGGTGLNTFSPNATCTRGQVVTFLWRAAGSPEANIVINPFVDVAKTDYFYTPVLWAVEKGITGGTGPNTFSPDATCTRGQVVTFLWRAAGSPNPETLINPFVDVFDADYYYKPVLWAVENGITGGTGPNTFSPNVTCTRAQVVTFLYKAAQVDIETVPTPDTPDVLVTDAYVDTVQEDKRSFCYHIPKINMEGDLAKGLNESIYDTYYTMMENEVYNNAKKGYPISITYIDYIWGTNGDLGSILMEDICRNDAYVSYQPYHFSTATGKQANDAEILAAYGMTVTSFHESVRFLLQGMMETYDFPEVFTESDIKWVTEQTLSDENVQDAIPFINANGELSFISGYYWIAGSGYVPFLMDMKGNLITITCEVHK